MQIVMAVVIAGLAVGCVGDGGFDLGSTEQHAEAGNKLAGNKLAGNRLAANKLAGNGLSTASTDLAALAAEEDGRELLTYMMSCALPAGTALVVGDYVFTGLVGLAPHWIDRSLSISDRRWVSACLLARVNAFGVTVQLSMRGSTGALRTSKVERTSFALYEGAFWGDIFAGDMRACTSRYKAGLPQVSTMPLRACTEDAGNGLTACGFAFAGICEDVCNSNVDGSFNQSCGEATEVISVFLAAP